MVDLEKAIELDAINVGQQGSRASSPPITAPNRSDLEEEKDLTIEAYAGPKRAKFLHEAVFVPQASDPRAYSRSQKWLITTLVAAAAAIDSTSTDIFYRVSTDPFEAST